MDNVYSLPEVNFLPQVYRSRSSNKNSKYKYRSHEEQCQGEHKTKTLRFNPNLILTYASRKKNLVFDFDGFKIKSKLRKQLKLI